MDLVSEKNLDHRLETVLSHHNAIRKGLEKIFDKENLKRSFKIAPEILKYSQPVWKLLDDLKSKKKKYYLRELMYFIGC